MPSPVTSLDDFFPTYLALLQAKDCQGLGALYAEDAVLTSLGPPGGDVWAVGRAEIVERLSVALQTHTVITEVPPDIGYTLRTDDVATRYGRFYSTVRSHTDPTPIDLGVDAFEVLIRNSGGGWQYLTDQSRVVSTVTTPSADGTA